jgi:hypothetical protein
MTASVITDPGSQESMISSASSLGKYIRSIAPTCPAAITEALLVNRVSVL